MKKSSPLFIIAFFLLFAFVSSSCKKEQVEHQICSAGPGGNVELAFYVYHHDSLIPGAIIYLKYNETEFPGTNPLNYDLTLQTGTTGHGNGHTHIPNMSCGKYYVYSEGFDPDLNDTLVTGGRPFEVTQRDGSFTVNVFVTQE
jgi:hypothetical protein